MPENPINNECEHQSALREIERLWDAADGSADGDRLDILITQVEAYEDAHFPIDLPNPAKTK